MFKLLIFSDPYEIYIICPCVKYIVEITVFLFQKYLFNISTFILSVNNLITWAFDITIYKCSKYILK